jgi:hypothetical protein
LIAGMSTARRPAGDKTKVELRLSVVGDGSAAIALPILCPGASAKAPP